MSDPKMGKEKRDEELKRETDQRKKIWRDQPKKGPSSSHNQLKAMGMEELESRV